jgi:Holliday junction DNA helicase RuvA
VLIAAVRGVLEERGPGYAVVTVGGISLRLFAPTSTLAALDGIGAPVQLYTYLLVREDALTLFGFATLEERALFEQLLTVSGVGPRGALALLSAMEVDTLRAAIASGDVSRLTLVPGIGRKTAERLVLELRGKIGQPAAIAADTRDEMAGDVAAALTTMGYTQQQIQEALRAIGPATDLTLEQRILRALEYFRAQGGRSTRSP